MHLDAVGMKTCTQCGEEKPMDGFHRERRRKDGRRSECRACISDRTREYRMRPAVRERMASYFKQYYADHREEQIRAAKAWREQNPDRMFETRRVYRERNKERIAAKKRADYRANPQWILNAHARRQGNIGDAKISKKQWLSLMRMYQWRCFYCGEALSTKKNRTVDHIIPLSRGGAHSMLNLVPSCRTCNISKKDRLDEWRGWEALPPEKMKHMAARLLLSILVAREMPWLMW